MKSLIAKKHTNIHHHSNAFKLAFEVEYLLNPSENWYDVECRMQQINRNIICGTDGSLIVNESLRSQYNYHANSWGMEVKTPPLPINESLELLHKVFNLVNKVGYTNQSCGMHCNISPTNREVYMSLDPFKLIKNPLWKKMVKQFGRETNCYCKPIVFEDKATPLQKFTNIIYEEESHHLYNHNYNDHTNAVNFEHYDIDVQRATSRLEIRAMGNTDYHKKFPLIVQYVNQILNVFKRSYTVKWFK